MTKREFDKLERFIDLKVWLNSLTAPPDREQLKENIAEMKKIRFELSGDKNAYKLR